MKTPEPIEIAQDAMFELSFFVQLAWQGLEYAQTAVRLAKAVRRGKTSLGEQEELEDELLFQAKLQDYKKVEEFANEQANKGFPYLYETATVRLWTILETAADDFTLTLLEEFPKVLETEIIENLKGPLVIFLQASPEERADILLERLKREVNASLQVGVGRFEAVFKAIGFGGPVPETARRQLLELSEVRHSIVHRNSKVDAKVTQRCPWLGMKEGEKIRVTQKQHRCHSIAVTCYLSELLRRCVITGFSDPCCPDPKDRIREFEEFRDELATELGKYETNNKGAKSK